MEYRRFGYLPIARRRTPSPFGSRPTHGENKLLFTGDTYYPAPIWLFRPETDLAAYAKSIQRLAALAEVNTVLGAHNIPVAPPTVLPALVQAFADLQAGKAACKPEGTGKKVCTVDKFSFLPRAAP